MIPLPTQMQVIRDVRKTFDYSKGVHEIMLSGSVGSAKTLLLAHLIITHCLFFKRAHFGIGRYTRRELTDTLLNVILQHIDGLVTFDYNKTIGQIIFMNDSKITSHSWSDKNTKKFRSYEFSGFAIEELTENKSEDFYKEIYMRVGRLRHVPEKILISATNPDEPDHWAYKRFIDTKKPNVHTYYSKTHENPYLPEGYIEQLETSLDPKMLRRMLYGEWLSISKEVIYYAYDDQHNFIDAAYEVKEGLPFMLSFDFNIALGKPMSAAIAQFDGTNYHFFDEVVVEGARTESVLEEIYGRGYFSKPDRMFLIYGDATGRHKDTRSNHSDYSIIEKFLANVKTSSGAPLKFKMCQGLKNPKIRDRHNLVNGFLHNSREQHRIKVYAKAKTIREGLKSCRLKESAHYIEDDSQHFQHITTAVGYLIYEHQNSLKTGSSVSML